MSSKNNVNPDHYKTRGRQRQGETILHEQQKQALAAERTAKKGGRGRRRAARIGR